MTRTMVIVVRRAALVGLFAVCVACGDQARPTAPSPSPAAPPPPVNVTPFPPQSGATTTYSFSDVLENDRVSGFTTASSFVLYETGAFYLQYEAFAYRYRGRYEREDRQITFYFSERSHTADATGTLKGNLLEVRYSEIMQQSDFENAVYQRVD